MWSLIARTILFVAAKLVFKFRLASPNLNHLSSFAERQLTALIVIKIYLESMTWGENQSNNKNNNHHRCPKGSSFLKERQTGLTVLRTSSLLSSQLTSVVKKQTACPLFLYPSFGSRHESSKNNKKKEIEASKNFNFKKICIFSSTGS